MSGSEVPYQLRPNKYVDRQLFAECLRKIGTIRNTSSYVYASMGGRYLDDARVIYSVLGTRNITSFEQDYTNYERQEFNKPHDFIKCMHRDSKSFVDDFSSYTSSYDATANFIVWLDYADASKRLSQLQEFESLLAQMEAWDIARITLNANPLTFGTPEKAQKLNHELKDIRLQNYKSILGQYSCNPQKSEMTKSGLPSVLARTVEVAAHKALKGRSDLVVRVLAAFSYNDSSHMMLTVTCILLPAQDADKFMDHQSITGWKYLPTDWGQVRRIDVPVLSLKEKISIDRFLLSKSPTEIHANLGFKFDQELDASINKVEQYVEYHQHYPNFVRADI